MAITCTLNFEAAERTGRNNARPLVWTAGPQRLDRDIQAAFLSADFEFANEPRPDHAAYVENWLKVLRNDKRAIFTAASKAQHAVDWMHSRQDTDLLSETGAVLVEAT